ncbi:MAG: lysophospholipid acyltransferase family protein [Planctomycetales bacterium]|nr:lysophospholipid acyltransferase family protein [Planctomycetales bacterium]
MASSASLLNRLAGFGGSMGIRAWMSTLDYRGYFYDPAVDPIYPSDHPRIYVFWHEYILVPLYLRGHCNLTMLLSKHRDADVLDRLAYHLGFDCVRGSTYNGATSALMELARKGRQMHLTITPDGPRGPRRTLAQGAVFLASRLQLPIVPFGVGIDRPWRAKSWDRFAIPKPGSRVRAFVGPEVWIPRGLDRDELEVRRQGVERMLNGLCEHSEAWAQSGADMPGSVVARRQGRILGADAGSLCESLKPAVEKPRLYAGGWDAADPETLAS